MGESINVICVLVLDREAREASGMLLMHSKCDDMTRVTLKMALRAGSSQHGKARRASKASNCVEAMILELPSISV